MTVARTAVSLPASGVGGCLREGVARRPWMAGGIGTDGSRLTPMVTLINQLTSVRNTYWAWVENAGRSIKESDTPHYGLAACLSLSSVALAAT
jgi:hypothetical protein